MKFFIVIAFLFQLKYCHNLNILGIAPLIGKSHFIMFEAIFKELARRGHNVDVVGHFPLKEKLPRYNDLPIKGNFPVLVNNMTVDFVAHRSVWSTLDLMMTVAGPNMCRDVLETETLKKLRNSTKKYDLLITEFFGTDCMLGFAHLFDIPSITLTTSVTLPWTASYIGFPDNPSYIPVYFVPFRCPMSLLERLFNTAAYVMLKIGYDVLSMIDSNVHARHFFGPGLPDLRDLAKNVSLFLVNSHFSVHISRPTVPNFVEVAGVHINENYTLSQYFQESLKTDLNGIIYLSFGSMLMTESFPVDKIRGLFEAFRKIPYKILWKANKERFPENLDFPSNIQFEPWMPQLGILCHPNVKVFVSHGGMMGTLEALHCGVPVLGIPVFADQMLNIQTNAAKGLATYVSYSNITEESISEALNSLLEDCRYQQNAKRASKLFKDRPKSPLDTAIYWIEYVARHKGARHLRNVGADLPWYEYFLVDVILIYSTITAVLTFVMYLIVMYLYRSLMGQKPEKMKRS